MKHIPFPTILLRLRQFFLGLLSCSWEYRIRLILKDGKDIHAFIGINKTPFYPDNNKSYYNSGLLIPFQVLGL